VAFDSFLEAMFVLGCLPFGLIGGVIAALVLPEGLSMASLIGFVTLAGIVCRNAILLVIHERHSLDRREQEPAGSVILRAAGERLIPIVMTAATAFFGLLPLALASGQAGSELESPMAVVVCAGLVTSTIANLFVVPAFFFWRHRERNERTES
jgi:multidrug efflux pump subunit AcrB